MTFELEVDRRAVTGCHMCGAAVLLILRLRDELNWCMRSGDCMKDFVAPAAIEWTDNWASCAHCIRSSQVLGR